MGLIDDPISGIIGKFLQHAIESRIWKRLELCLEIFLAGVFSFDFGCGTMLVSHQQVAFSIGCGMCSSAVAMILTFYLSPNAKGLTLALPEDVADAAENTNTTKLDGGKGK